MRSRDPGLLGAATRGLGLRRRQRDAGDVDAVALGGVDGERAPAAADVEHALAALEAELLAHELELGLLRRLEVGRAAREDRARVGHRRAEEEAEELGRHVVVVADGARVALDRVEAALRLELGGRRAGRADRPGGAEGGERELGLRAAVDLGRLPRVDHLDDGVEVVDVERAGHVGAAEAELAGRAQDVGERLRRAGGEGRAAVRDWSGGSSAPSHRTTRNGRSGSASSSAERNEAVPGMPSTLAGQDSLRRPRA